MKILAHSWMQVRIERFIENHKYDIISASAAAAAVVISVAVTVAKALCCSKRFCYNLNNLFET